LQKLPPPPRPNPSVGCTCGQGANWPALAIKKKKVKGVPISHGAGLDVIAFRHG